MTQPWQQNPYQRRPVDINAYAPPKRPGGAGWFIGLGVAVLAIVLAVVFLRPSAPSPVPVPSPSQSSATSASGPGMPFTAPGVSGNEGRWEVLEQRWNGDELILRVKVSADKGTISYGFVAFSNAGTSVYKPVPGGPQPELSTGRLSAGGSAEGYVMIDMPKGPATLILTTQAGNQISALPING